MTLIHVFVFRLTNTRLLPKQRHLHFQTVEDAAEVVLQVKFTSNTRNVMKLNKTAICSIKCVYFKTLLFIFMKTINSL